MTTSVERARAAFAGREWAAALAAYAEAEQEQALEATDLEQLAVAAHLTGADERSSAAWEAAFRTAMESGDPARAGRCSFWLGMSLMLAGQGAQAAGWLARGARVIDDARVDCAAAGYLLIPSMLHDLEGGRPAEARDLAIQATAIGTRFGDPDLHAFGILGYGQALIALGDAAGGLASLDEVMVAATADELGPITTGIVYCAVLIECMQLLDLRRASEWTNALSSWCDGQPDLVPYRGQCLVHRSQLQQAAGEWDAAMTTALHASARLADPPHPAVGWAHYQAAELHRMLGAFDDAADAYRRASRAGRSPTPGLALLELARGDASAAAATIGRALQETTLPFERPGLLAAAVDIHLGQAELAPARAAAEELRSLAAASTSDALIAMAAQSIGAVLLDEGDPAGALVELRAAAARWQRLRMPYEAARVGVLLARACAALGDETSAALERDNARELFTELGAAPELERLDATPSAGPAADLLSGRELEVLTLVASGLTNRDIAAQLVISQHTVGRHVEHIFTKLGVSSRAAATAYAYENGLL